MKSYKVAIVNGRFINPPFAPKLSHGTILNFHFKTSRALLAASDGMYNTVFDTFPPINGRTYKVHANLDRYEIIVLWLMKRLI